MNRLLILTGLGLTLLLVPSCGSSLPNVASGLQSAPRQDLTIVGETHLVLDLTDSNQEQLFDSVTYPDNLSPQEQVALEAKVQYMLSKIISEGKAQATVELEAIFDKPLESNN